MHRKKRVLQLGPFPPPFGGVQTNMLAIRDRLLENGDECAIISIVNSERTGEEENVYHPRNPPELVRLLLKLKYDFLHIHIGGNLPPRVLALVLTAATLAPGKSVLTLHSGGYAVEKIEAAKFLSTHGFIFRRLTKIIVVNQLMSEMFVKFGVKPENIKEIPPFALSKSDANVEIPQKFLDFWDNHKKVLLAVSALETHYDLPLQINALEKVRKKFPETGLIILGSGSAEKELRELAASKSYAEHVFLAGEATREVVLHLIERSDVLLRTTVFDGDAISIREAIFLGTPVVATDNGMRPEMVRLIPMGDAAALEAAIEEQLKGGRKPQYSGADGRENIKAVLDIYEELMQK
ncbi:MAG: glycosyltransferase family 4 protein [Acidobacteria bacterium]|jgi:glycosyltransferase involved in cell wall biosynthesis|nr:glycosyltransferase family 4 protein [Acidobacteriota bacterium]